MHKYESFNPMKMNTHFFVLTSLAISIVADPSRAAVVFDGTDTTINGFTLGVTENGDVGDGSEGLKSFTLSVSGTGVNGVSAVIGSNGALHHEQFSSGFPVAVQGPSFDTTTSAGSAVDSHFVATPDLTLIPLTEALVDGASSDEAGQFGPSPMVTTGFGGPLEGGFSFAATDGPVDFVQLVTSQSILDGSGIDFSFTFSNEGGQEGIFTGSLISAVTSADPMLVGTPDAPGPIDLTPEFNDFSNFRDDAIVLSNGGTGELGAITLTEGGDNPELFVPTLDGLNIDIGLDLSSLNLSSILPNTTFTSTLNVAAANDGDGDLLYTLSVTVPEPSTVGLFSLALVGLAGLRRRG